MRGQNPAATVPVLSSEVADADLGDLRLNYRLGLLIDSIADRPSESFPKVLDDAALEAAYRFFGNASVTPDAILAPHFRQTRRRSIDAAEALLDGKVRAIHVMDREADSYAILSALDVAKRRYVIRSFQDRVLADEESRLRATAKAANRAFDREVPLSRRPVIDGPKGQRHPARHYRVATLSFAAKAIEIPRTVDARTAGSPTLALNVIYVSERKPPPGEPAVEWFLLTNLPIGTSEEIAFAVDCYRGRWTIEEYFKALKTGCQYEKRQLESAHSLLNALAILAPVAWRLLLLRHLARHAPERPASDALTPTQLEVLHATAKRPLPTRPTIREAMLAVAGLGGHLPRNGDPGWLVLRRGMHDLLLLELGWRARDRAEKWSMISTPA